VPIGSNNNPNAAPRGVFVTGDHFKFNNNNVSFSSDDRLKDNEKNIENPLNKLNQIKVQEYTKYIFDPITGNIDSYGSFEMGVIAQDLLNTDMSFCVGKNYYGTSEEILDLSDNFYYDVTYNNLFTLNIAATKELDAIVQVQESEIVSLKNKNTILENEITLLNNENNLIKSKLNEILIEMGKETI
jgi:hypothetical protein